MNNLISVSVGAICAGTVLAWTAPALSQILIPETENATLRAKETGAPGFTIDEKEGAMVGSMLTIGALVAALPVGYIADKIGRRKTILMLSAPFVLNWILIIFSTNVAMVIAGRFFAGVGLGGVCVVVPMYIGEIADASSRGVLGSFFNLFLGVGMLTACVVGYFTNWVGLSLILAIFPIAFGVSYFFIPETPTFLCEKQLIEQAERVLTDLRGSNYNVSEEVKSIEKSIEESRANSKTFAEIFSNRGNIRAIISVCGVLAYQQLCGINAIVMYVDPIFKTAGSSLSSTIAGIILTLVQLVSAYLMTLLIEKANRKLFLVLSSTGMLLCMAALGMFFHLKNIGVDTSSIGFLPISSCVLYMIAFSVGYGPIPWMLLGELYSSEIKGLGSGLGVVTNWIAAFLVTLLFPIFNSSLGNHITFYIFSCILASASLFVYFVVPETRGKTLPQIQQELNR